jgi:hypothetical protein
MIKPMDLVFTYILMEQSMKVIGKKINKMELERKHGQMELGIVVIIKMVKNVVKVNFIGQMGQNMMVIF